MWSNFLRARQMGDKIEEQQEGVWNPFLTAYMAMPFPYISIFFPTIKQSSILLIEEGTIYEEGYVSTRNCVALNISYLH